MSFICFLRLGNSKWSPPPESSIGLQEINKKDNKNVSIRLFNMKQDPTERYDVAASHPDIVMMLLGRLAEYQATAVAPLDHYMKLKYPQWNATLDANLQYWLEIPNAFVHLTGVWGQWIDSNDEVAYGVIIKE